MVTSEIVQQIITIILEERGDAHLYKCAEQQCKKCADTIYDKVNIFVTQNRQIEFILPAFPAKSANRDKTLGALPDHGEELGLINLNRVMSKINSVYKPGAKIIICSDGRVFNDVVMVNDRDVDAYLARIHFIVNKFHLTDIDFFDLGDFYCGMDFITMRKKLTHDFAVSIEELKNHIKNDSTQQYLFNGLHRFIYEDLYGLQEHKSSKNRVRKQAQQLAYLLIQRSHAWSALIKSLFTEGIRLSIHPHQCGGDKLAFQLIPSSQKWATPWHNVVVKDSHGNIKLMKNKEAKLLAANIVYIDSLPSYYQINHKFDDLKVSNF